MSLLKLSCKKAAEMIEQEKIVSLSFIDKLNLKFHLSICKKCQNYQKQSQLIDDFFSKESHEEDVEKNIPLKENPQLKETILNKLNR